MLENMKENCNKGNLMGWEDGRKVGEIGQLKHNGRMDNSMGKWFVLYQMEIVRNMEQRKGK